MTCIAWDGATLAADKRACNGSLARTTTKIFCGRIHGFGALLGMSGDSGYGMMLVNWAQQGMKIEQFPTAPAGQAATLLVILRGLPGGTSPYEVETYDTGPYGLQIHDRTIAIGSGRDFALGAMEMGATAELAVRAACKFDVYCGNGIDVLTVPE